MNNLALLTKKYGPGMSAPAREYINMAMTGAEMMRELVNDLLEYSRIDAKGKPSSSVDLNEVVRNTLASLQVAIEESGAKIAVEHLPTVWGDGVQLAQVIQNLVSNAIKFHRPRPAMVSIRSSDTIHEWIVAVEDNVTGIEPSYSDRIFQMFQRMHSREEYKGTGMGLAISKKIMERHGGRIWVES
jgi:light-regulated signal transduction histidine kinase (bacteriophytochrome)